MTRRSITLYPVLETVVREMQAKLLTSLKRDVSFTEALNVMVLAGFTNSSFSDSWTPEHLKTFLDSDALRRDAVFDSVRDLFPNELVQQMEALQAGH